jgi:predicted negative regulator of RcsB-dependent stress response
MRFRFLDRFRLSPHAHRRLQRIGETTLRWVGAPFRFLFGLAKSVGHVFASWWDSRNLRYLLQGLPALVVTIALLVVATLILFQDKSALAQQYKDKGEQSLADAYQKQRQGLDPKVSIDTAQMCYKRLSVLQNSPEVNYHMADTYVLQRQGAAAESIFSDLAPLFKVTNRVTIPALNTANVPERVQAKLKPMMEVGYSTQEAFLEKLYEVLDKDEIARYGNLILAKSIFYEEYGPANYQVAMRLLLSPHPQDKQAQSLQDAQLHLRRAIHFNKEPQASLARFTLARLLRAMNQPDEAENFLTEAVQKAGKNHPEWRMELAEWCRQNGKKEAARTQYEAAAVTLEQLVKDNMYDHDSRIRLIESLRLLGIMRCTLGDYKKGKEDLSHAEELCNTGRNIAQDPAIAYRYKGEVGLLFLAQYDSTANDPATSPTERFGKLERALTLFPSQPDVLKRLAAFMRTSGPEADKARAVIQKMIDEGNQSPVVLMIWGNYHWEKGNLTEAKFYWDKAMSQNDWPAEVANNLAWIVAFHLKPADLDRALVLVDQALKKEDKPEFRGTRGHILAEMGRDRDAYNDLEAAKSAYATNPNTTKQAADLYARLAKVCERLGLKDEVSRYQRLAEQKMGEFYRTPAGRAAAAQAAAAQAQQNKPNEGSPTVGSTPEKKEPTGTPPPKP